MHIIQQIFSYMERCPAMASIITAIVGGILTIFLNFIKFRSKMRNEYFNFMYNCYSEYSRNLFKIRSLLHKKSPIELIPMLNKENWKEGSLAESSLNNEYFLNCFDMSLCSSGRAFLSGDTLVKTLMEPVTQCLIDYLIHKKSEFQCDEHIEDLLNAMNSHLKRLRCWFLLRWFLTFKSGMKAKKIKQKRKIKAKVAV